MQSNNLELLQSLVHELLQNSPNETEIKSLMEKAGIDYYEDPIQQMNEVLKALHSQPKRDPEVEL